MFIKHCIGIIFVHKFQVALLILLLTIFGDGNKIKGHLRYQAQKGSSVQYTKTICMQMGSLLRARHKSCFLRPDTGPCRADILQWYFDVKQRKCFRFFWGGCQGNGNRFESKKECYDYCMLNTTNPPSEIPNFCSLTFDYGTCFGYFNRWAWDTFTKTCKNRIYSGCGGNQNNFETKTECLETCLRSPNNSLINNYHYTTCVPYDVIL